MTLQKVVRETSHMLEVLNTKKADRRPVSEIKNHVCDVAKQRASLGDQELHLPYCVSNQGHRSLGRVNKVSGFLKLCFSFGLNYLCD